MALRGLDFNIPLQGQAMKVNSPMETMGKLYTFQAMQAEAEERQRQARLARQADEEQAVMNEAFNSGPLDRTRIREFLQTAKMGHLIPKAETLFDGWDKSRAEVESKAAEAKQKADEAEMKKKQYLANGARDLFNDGLDLAEVVAFIDHSSPILGPEAAAIRQQALATKGDPNALKQIVSVWAAAATDQAGYINATTNRDDAIATRAGKTAESTQKVASLAAGRLLQAKNQAEYDLLLEYETPESVRGLFPREFKPEAIKQAGLTSNERVQAEDRDLTRAQTAKRDAMYDRANRVREGQAAAALREQIRQFDKRVEVGDIAATASGGGATARGVSATRMSEIEGWLYTQKQGLQKMKDEGQIEQPELDRRLKELDTAYQRQLRPPAFTLGELANPVPGPPAFTTEQRGTLGGPSLASPLTLGSLNAPIIPPEGAIAPPPAVSAPASTPKLFTTEEVNTLLGGPRRPGRYELDDGTVWEVRPGQKPRRIS